MLISEIDLNFMHHYIFQVLVANINIKILKIQHNTDEINDNKYDAVNRSKTVEGGESYPSVAEQGEISEISRSLNKREVVCCCIDLSRSRIHLFVHHCKTTSTTWDAHQYLTLRHFRRGIYVIVVPGRALDDAFDTRATMDSKTTTNYSRHAWQARSTSYAAL